MLNKVQTKGVLSNNLRGSIQGSNLGRGRWKSGSKASTAEFVLLALTKALQNKDSSLVFIAV